MCINHLMRSVIKLKFEFSAQLCPQYKQYIIIIIIETKHYNPSMINLSLSFNIAVVEWQASQVECKWIWWNWPFSYSSRKDLATGYHIVQWCWNKGNTWNYFGCCIQWWNCLIYTPNDIEVNLFSGLNLLSIWWSTLHTEVWVLDLWRQ